MNNFFAYFNEDIGLVFKAFMEALGACFNFFNYLFNFPMRMGIIKEHVPGFTTGDWVMLLVVNIALVAACVSIIILVGKFFRKIIFSFTGVSKKEYDRMATEVRSLHMDLLRSNYEKDKILAMHVGKPEEPPKDVSAEQGEEGVPDMQFGQSGVVAEIQRREVGHVHIQSRERGILTDVQGCDGVVI